MIDRPRRAPSSLAQLAAVILCFVLVITWVAMGFLSGVKGPFTIAIFSFEQGYQPNESFMANLGNIVMMIVTAFTTAAGFTIRSVMPTSRNEASGKKMDSTLN